MGPLVLLLVSLVAHLVSPAPHNLTLNHVIDAASNYSKTLQKEYFVEDVTDLADNCNDIFFCKVQQILTDHHRNNPKDHDDKTVLRNLNVYIEAAKIDCEVVLKGVMKSDKSRPLTDFLENLTKCSRNVNFHGGLQTKNK